MIADIFVVGRFLTAEHYNTGEASNGVDPTQALPFCHPIGVAFGDDLYHNHRIECLN
jgi:hypothetical protein